MAYHSRFSCLLFFAGLVASTGWYVSAALAENPQQIPRAKIEAILAEVLQDSKAPGISCAVSVDNQICFTGAYGLSDLEHDLPVTNETRFRTASIAKPMTATLILSLVEQGKIELDAEVQAYCAYPQKEWPVTVRQVLGHLGGIRHYKSRAEALSTTHYFSLTDALQTFAEDPLVHEPGSKYLYSSFGYNLLGSVAEGATDSDFMSLLQEHVIAPAGMEHTTQDDHFAIIKDRSRGYIRATVQNVALLPRGHNWQFGQVYNAPLHDTSVKIPGGGLLSTASDLSRFANALNRGMLVSEATRELMWTPQHRNDGAPTSYGLGWGIGTHREQPVISHSGGQSGTSTMLTIFPEQGINVVLMCNLQHVGLRPVALKIAELFLPEQETTDYSQAIRKLDTAIRHEVEQKQLPAFSIAVVDQDQTVWETGYGSQDKAGEQPATEHTVYRVGSISKLFTDVAVMQLVESEQLDLEAPAKDYLPWFSPNNEQTPITLRQLMSHRSGLVRESPVGNYFDPSQPSLDATVRSLNQTSLVYPPDSKTKYSNAAVSVVGAVLESQLEVSHPTRVFNSILQPLGMAESGFEVTDQLLPRVATGWMRTYDGRRRFVAPEFQLGTGPAGNLYSSVHDLAKFIRCVLADGKTPAGGAILEPASLQRMMSPVKDAQGQPLGFGLGFHVQELDNHRVVGHGGAIYGFSTQLEILPDEQIGVVAAASLDGSNGIVKRLANYALRLMLAAKQGKPLPEYRLTSPIPISRARKMVGSYRNPSTGQIAEINELEGRVFLQRGTYRHELRADSNSGQLLIDDEFAFGTSVGWENADTAPRLTIGTEEFVSLPDEPPPPPNVEWQKLLGEYGWDHNTLYILERHGELYCLIEWFYYYPLRQIDSHTFAFPDYGLYHGEHLSFHLGKDQVPDYVIAAEVRFDRREVGTEAGETFQINPLKSAEELRPIALAAQPPEEDGDFRTAELVELTALDDSIELDIRYASDNNFMGAVFYQQARAFMQKPAAEAVVRANARLKAYGLGLLVHDAYRPWFVTKMFWDATPQSMKDFVANPASGSRHNRGCAVDITLYDLSTGNPIQMVAGYDEFSQRSFPLYPGGTSRQRWYRDLLRRVMEAENFSVYEFEWWHFDYQDWRSYRIGNRTFEEILSTASSSP